MNTAEGTPFPSRDTLETLKGRRVLVTGVNGFLGAWTAALAHRAGAVVTGVDLPSESSRGRRFRTSIGCGDVSCLEVGAEQTGAQWESLCREIRPDAILHLAGTTNRSTDEAAWKSCVQGNTLLTLDLVNGILTQPDEHRPVVLFPGSQMEYGSAEMPWREDTAGLPTTPYGGSKLAASALLQSLGLAGLLRTCILRFPLVFGPGQQASMFVPEVIIKGFRGLPIEMTEGRQRRRFVFAPDAARTLLTVGSQILKGSAMPPILNAPAYDPLSIAELARFIADGMKCPIDLRIGALPMRKMEIMEAWPDTSIADSLRLIQLTPMHEAISRTIEWYRDNPWFFQGAGAGGNRTSLSKIPGPERDNTMKGKSIP